MGMLYCTTLTCSGLCKGWRMQGSWSKRPSSCISPHLPSPHPQCLSLEPNAKRETSAKNTDDLLTVALWVQANPTWWVS